MARRACCGRSGVVKLELRQTLVTTVPGFARCKTGIPFSAFGGSAIRQEFRRRRWQLDVWKRHMMCYIVHVDVWTKSRHRIVSHRRCGFNRSCPTLQSLCGRVCIHVAIPRRGVDVFKCRRLPTACRRMRTPCLENVCFDCDEQSLPGSAEAARPSD